MNPVQNLKELTAVVAYMAKYSAEDYKETEEAVQRGLEIARVRLIEGHHNAAKQPD